MTFTEAAVEVLRLVGKPLHYRKIAELAIERNLLSHVGKTPEITMSSRLATMVKKDRGEAPIVKVKPGVFGLRDFSEDVLAAAEKESGHEYELPKEPDAVETSAEDSATDAVETKHPGQDVFPEEEGDDEPIMANLDEDEDGKGKRRRRRRRRRRGEGEDAPSDSVETRSDPRRSERRERRPRDGGKDDRSVSRREVVRGDWQREPEGGEHVGQGLSDALVGALERSRREPVRFVRAAELLVRSGKMSGSPDALAPTIAAAVRSDIARFRGAGLRPRFRLYEGGLGLADWDQSPEAVRAEREVVRAAEKQRQHIYRSFLKSVAELPTAGRLELLASWLNVEGVEGLHAVRRPSAKRGELHLAGTLRRGLEESRVAIVVYLDERDIGREAVIDVRGALHHYEQAHAAWLITTGQVLSGAKEESLGGSPAVTLFDGPGLARAMERARIGLVTHSVPVLAVDRALLEGLGLGAATVRDGATEAEEDETDDAARSTDGAAPRGRRRRGRRRRAGEEDRETRRAADPLAFDEEDSESGRESAAASAVEGVEPSADVEADDSVEVQSVEASSESDDSDRDAPAEPLTETDDATRADGDESDRWVASLDDEAV